jgi:peptide/nickel transport system permease protein
MTPTSTAADAAVTTNAPRARRWTRLPIVSHYRQSVGLQRGMLVGGLVLTGIFLLTALFAPLLSPYGYSQLRGANGAFGAQQAPSKEHLLGTTQGGLDVLSRLIWGTRTALYVIVVAVLASIIVGVFLGLVSGYFGGWLDRVLIVVADAVYSFPSLLLAIVLAIMISGGQSSLWGGVLAAALSITVVFIPQYLRVTRAEVVRIKSEAFVESARVIGASNFRIMTRHVLRNATRTLPLILTLNASEAILTLAGLGFLGFGIEPTKAAEWGYDLNKSIADVSSGIWWTAVFPGAAIVLVVLGLTLVGESLNDLADPRLRKRAAGAEPVEDLGVQVPVAAHAADVTDAAEPPAATKTGEGDS